MNLTSTMIAAAVGGILMGAAACGGSTPPPAAPENSAGTAAKYSFRLPIPLLSEPTWRLAALKSQREDRVSRPNKASPHGTDAVGSAPRGGATLRKEFGSMVINTNIAAVNASRLLEQSTNM